MHFITDKLLSGERLNLLYKLNKHASGTNRKFPSDRNYRKNE